MRSSPRSGSLGFQRASGARAARAMGLVLALGIVLVPAGHARADAERLRVAVGFARSLNRFQSFSADSAGLSLVQAYGGDLDVDFRVFDAPLGTTRPSLHVSVGGLSDERTLAPYLPGQTMTHMPVYILRSGAYLLVPLDLVRPNTGVAMRLGWTGGYVMGRRGGSEFLTISKGRFGFERTGGWFEGTCVEMGMGRDDTYGRDAASGRWDVHAALHGRLLPPPARIRPGPASKAGKATPAAPEGHARVLWAFADVVVDTDGATGPDGVIMRFGVAMDVAGALQALTAR